MLGLAAEALEHGRLGGQLRRQNLEGDLLVGLRVARLVDRPHAASGDVLQHLIFADPDAPTRPLGGGGSEAMTFILFFLVDKQYDLRRSNVALVLSHTLLLWIEERRRCPTTASPSDGVFAS